MKRLAIPIAFVYNLSIRLPILPALCQAFRHAQVVPLYKGKGDVRNLGNFRSASPFPFLAQLFKRTLLLQFQAYFADSNFHSSHQHGLRSFRSTETALLNFKQFFLDAWRMAILAVMWLLRFSTSPRPSIV